MSSFIKLNKQIERNNKEYNKFSNFYTKALSQNMSNIVQKNNSTINLQGKHNSKEEIIVMGNMNDISIGDSHCMVQITGNGNTIHIIHAKIRLTLHGNGNSCSSIESKLQLKLQGNANNFKSEFQISPMEVFNCQGFGNQFPQNTIYQNQMNVTGPNSSSNVYPMNSNNTQNTSTNNMMKRQKRPVNLFGNPNLMPPSNNLIDFNNSRNAIQNYIKKANELSQMVDQDQQKQQEHHRNSQQLQRRANQWANRNVNQAQKLALKAQQQAMKAQQQAIKVHQLERKRQIQMQQQHIRKMQEYERTGMRKLQQDQQKKQEQLRKRNQQIQRGIFNFFGLKKEQQKPAHNNQSQINQRNNDSRNNLRQRQRQPKVELPQHGLSDNELQRLHTHYHNGPQQQCTICLLEISTNDQETFLSCFHGFHSYCIQSWLKKSAKCPICSQNVRKNF